MKKIIFSFCMIFLAVSFTNQIHAQSKSCTPAQMAACKKISKTTTAANCTPAQKAACQKVCDKSASTRVTSTTVLENPGVLVGYSSSDSKKTTCSPSAKLTKNFKPSCTAIKTKVVQNETINTAPIAQKVIAENE